MLFFVLLGTASPLKTFYVSLHSTKQICEREGKCYLKTTEVFGCWWTCAYLRLISIKVKELHIVLRVTQTLDVLIFFKKKFCLKSGLKFTLSDAASLIVDDLPGLQKVYSVLGRLDQFSKNEEMKMVITTDDHHHLVVGCCPASWFFSQNFI